MIQTATYRQKVVKRFAPDAFILIMEQNYIQRADNNQQVYFNDDIENITINGSVDAPVASASFTINVPRKDRPKYFINPNPSAPPGAGKPIFELMMEVRIFVKGKFNVINADGTVSTPPPYQQFWGMITGVSDEYGGGSHKITVQCKDMLYWLQTQKMALRPSILTAQSTGAHVQPYSAVFANMSPKNIIALVVDFAFGGQRQGASKLISAVSLEVTLNSAQSFIGFNYNNAFSPNKLNVIAPSDFVSNQHNIFSNYWIQKFGLDVNDFPNGLVDDDDNPIAFLALKIYGFNGVIDPTSQPSALNSNNPATANANPQNTPATVNTNQNVSSPKQEALVGTKFGNMTAQSAVNASTVSGPVTTATNSSSYYDKIINHAAPFGQLANIDTMHTEYQSFLDVCITCRDYIGYEFYMSLEGDIVFKPPFYNLDVKTYRPFVIKDTDIISYTFSEGDDVITSYSVQGNMSQTVQTTGDIQARGTAFDAKLAQQFGIRAQTSDSQMSASVGTRQATFLALLAQNEMDRHNARRFSGSITLVGTPEIKLGYPVYIEPFDTYAYVVDVSHSFNFGSSFQTTITLTAFRRMSVAGANMVLAPSTATDPNSVINSTQAQTQENLNAETAGYVQGTGTNISKLRVLQQNTATDPTDPTNAIQKQIQLVTDYNGYEVIGILPYCANLLLDTTGNIQAKTSALNFSTTAYQGDYVLASQVAGIIPAQSQQSDTIPAPATTAPATTNPGQQIAGIGPQAPQVPQGQ